MALTREQFNELRNKGLTVNQIVQFESGQKPAEKPIEQPRKKESLFKRGAKATVGAFEGASKFLFGSLGETAGRLVGSAGEDVEKLTRPKELEQRTDPLLTKKLREQGKTDEEIKEQLLVKTEKEFKPEETTASDIAFTALETLPGGGVLTSILKKTKGGNVIAEGIEKFTQKLPDALKAQAVEEFKAVLGATTKKFKEVAEKIAPELAERKVTALSRKGLEKKATKATKEAGEAVSEVIERIPKETTLKTKPIVDAIEATKDKFTIKGVVVEPEKLKVADDLIEIVKEFGDELEAENIIQLRRVWDEVIAESGKGFGLEAKEAFKLKVKKIATNSIRNELAKEFPELAKVNKEFAFWNNVKSTVGETIKRTGGKTGFFERQAQQRGGVAGFITGGIQDAIIVGEAAKNFVKLTSSTVWKTMSAKKKTQLAEAIESGNATKIVEVIKRLSLGIQE